MEKGLARFMPVQIATREINGHATGELNYKSVDSYPDEAS